MNNSDRLLVNLDSIDKNIARIAITLFSISVFYLFLIYGISENIKFPIIGIELPKQYALDFGCPIIFFLFQITFVLGIAMLRVEEAIISEVNIMDHTLRKPTIFAMLYLLGKEADTFWSKFLWWFHVILICSFFYFIPIITCIKLIITLIQDNHSFISFCISIFCSLICIIEIIIVSIYSLKRVNRSRNKETD